jgi:hypothetical protein
LWSLRPGWALAAGFAFGNRLPTEGADLRREGGVVGLGLLEFAPEERASAYQ